MQFLKPLLLNFVRKLSDKKHLITVKMKKQLLTCMTLQTRLNIFDQSKSMRESVSYNKVWALELTCVWNKILSPELKKKVKIKKIPPQK